MKETSRKPTRSTHSRVIQTSSNLSEVDEIVTDNQKTNGGNNMRDENICGDIVMNKTHKTESNSNNDGNTSNQNIPTPNIPTKERNTSFQSTNSKKKKNNLISFEKFKLNKIWTSTSSSNDGDRDFYVIEAELMKSIDEISIIGIRYSMDKNRSLTNRIMWAVLIFLAFGLAIYQIKNLVENYLKYPTSTEIDVVYSQQINFPQVTICDNNYVKKSAAEYFGWVDYLQPLTPSAKIYLDRKNYTKYRQAKPANNTEIVKKRKLLSPGTEQIVDMFWSIKGLPTESMETTFTDFGQCLVFNSKNYKRLLNGPGPAMGFQILLFANHSESFIRKDYPYGYRVLINDQDEPIRMKEHGFKINLGEETDVAVSAINISRMKYPHGNCNDELNYHQVKCERTCLTRVIIDNCNCRPIYMQEIGNESICDYIEEICVDEVTYLYYTRKFNVSCSCPPMCNEINYKMFVTGAKLGDITGFVLKNKYKQLNSGNYSIWNECMFLKVYFSSMQYTTITSKAEYSEMALLSDLGGALGLLLGSTFFTVVELFEVLWNLVIYAFVKRQKTNIG
ncbi:hypothetical protein HELRODRAFT_180250 [Helobdella robusta]|uniref:Uncharacterized protein n=1 Tax=Helobdella robusta TaxID=6412 RepID=T1FFM8_HELRO|nr:hypothetical protein HELRODRAFT_180250 [Helobdella robusta]ESN94082.1 hypothetical protein HELRODRAFT_180250 [Helobdella robusta]